MCDYLAPSTVSPYRRSPGFDCSGHTMGYVWESDPPNWSSVSNPTARQINYASSSSSWRSELPKDKFAIQWRRGGVKGWALGGLSAG